MAERLKRAGEIYLIPLAQIIVIEENNGRIDYGDIESLAQSIKENGLTKPVTVQKVRNEDFYILKDGYRRMRAIASLVEAGEDFPVVKAILAPKGYNEDDTLFEQIISNDGKPFSKLEEGNVYRKLLGRGFSETDIAKRTGKSNTHVRNCLTLARVPKSVQNQIAEGKITENTVVAIVATVGDNNEEELIKTVEEAIADAPVDKPARPKNVKSTTLKTKPPIKRLEEVRSVLEEKGIENKNTQFFIKLLGKLKEKATPEELLELFLSEE